MDVLDINNNTSVSGDDDEKKVEINEIDESDNLIKDSIMCNECQVIVSNNEKLLIHKKKKHMRLICGQCGYLNMSFLAKINWIVMLRITGVKYVLIVEQLSKTNVSKGTWKWIKGMNVNCKVCNQVGISLYQSIQCHFNSVLLCRNQLITLNYRHIFRF